MAVNLIEKEASGSGKLYGNIFIDVVALAFLCYLIHSNNILNQNRKWPFCFSTMLTVLIIVAEGGIIIAGDVNADLRFLNVFCNVSVSH